MHSALLQRISTRPDGPLDITWLAAETPQLPLGRIRLRWEPALRSGWEVTAYLGLSTAEVLLGSWPAVPDDWPRLVRPTLHEVTCLCAALSFATDALDLSNRLSGV
ncbi:esterase [Streptomyces sp. NBC_01285]|uniref:esterase n=1 Tax=Streptomyces sp. NBC_01285 TaxID=2903813 RepID=UPI00224D5B09|nr:esterase [Streptomyces sp. NBC_01285]MCX4775117.1 esterase [Streptomyces sp. NBC_01285]